MRDAKLVKHILAGDEQAFAEFVSLYGRLVFGIVSKIVGQREDCEELTQDIFMKIFKNLPNFNEKAEFSTWIYRIAYNEAISFVRKNKKKQQLLDRNKEIENCNQIDAKEEDDGRLNLLRTALAQLKPKDRFLIQLFYQDECSTKEIAEKIGQSEVNVRIRLHRIRKKLEQLMNECNEG